MAAEPTLEDAAGWLPSPCALCGAPGGTFLFGVPIPAAPGGHSRIVSCDSCGLRRLDPRPSAAILSALYADDYYSYVGRRRSRLKQRVWDLLRDASSGYRPVPLPARVVATSIAHWRFDVNVPLEAGRGARVLDVGCGFGDLLLYFRDRGCSVVGVELDTRAADAAAELGLTVHAGALVEAGLEPSSFDVAIFQHSLEHLPDPVETIRESARLVRPGGSIHIAVPNGGSAGFEHERELWGAIFSPEHFWYFDAATLTELLAREGFRIESVATKTIWINHWRLLRWLLSRRENSPGLDKRIRLLGRAFRAVAGTNLRRRGDILRVVARRET